ncbi:MAG: oligosaccharide flippase family protein [Clostridia bacterium]|nr:oligosaccharide flippase family protein [Clostridia bacterium]
MRTSDSKARISSQALILTVTNLIISLVGLLSSMLLSRYRTLDEYGTYSQVIMVTELVSTVLLMGLPQTVGYFLSRAENEEEKKRFFTLYSILSTAITAVIGVCLFFATPLIVAYFNNPYITAFSYVFAVYPWSGIMINTLSSVLVVYGRSGKLACFTLIHSLTTLLTVILTVALSVEFERYVLIYIITTAVFAVVAFTLCAFRVGGFSLSGKMGSLLREIFAYAIPLGLASSVGSVNIQLDKLFIGTMFSTEEYALYMNASRALPITALATALTSVLLPKLVVLLKKEKNEDAVTLWGSSIKMSYIVLCALVGGIIVFAPDAMSLLYSEKYVTEASVAVFRIYALTMLFKVTYFGIILNSKGRTDLIFISALVSLITNCVGNVVFYHLLGFIGPAVSTLLVTVVMNLAQLFATSRITKLPFSRVFPYKAVLLFTIKTLLVCTPLALLYTLVISPLPRTASIPIALALGIAEVLAAVLISKRDITENWHALNDLEADEEKSDEAI